MHYYDFELCAALQSVGVDVTLLTCDETINVAIPPALTIEFPFRGIYGDASQVVRGFRYLRGLIQVGLEAFREGVELVHFHFFHFPPLDYLFFRWLRGRGIRIVLTAHDVIPFTTRQGDLVWLRRLYHATDGIVVHAMSNREVMRQTFDVDLGKIHVVPMGPYLQFADERSLTTSVARLRIGLAPDDPVVMFFGQIKSVKGLRHLIHAFRQVVDEYPSARLVIAGPEWKHSFAEYAALIEQLRLTERVYTRIEYIPDDELGLYYSAADIVALPYTVAYQSAVLYMAYSFAKPVVASAVAGLAEVVKDGETGLLVPPADPEALAQALLVLLRDPLRAQRMGRQGEDLVKTQFNWADIGRKIASIYTDIDQGDT
jgi:glycosyltransferase involved in cell wall biosynthesis